MSKRHQSNRRKTYGRRQHEVAERRQRDPLPDTLDLSLEDLGAGGMADRFTFLESRTPDLYYALGD